ncbi:GGDEF domain-containing phosphodiesterase [[Clostridium] symbiosum]|uniref:GGDEF domain-containing phosphodiesterase n=1 Tax=Clostridium symbiosum TaxID=1512 RepID=UPI001FAE2E37|nr:GGDEF domain-containing phosphodiesterase [[Clostridium] symbiosum]
MGTVEWQMVVDLTQIMDRRNGKDRLAELIELVRQEQKMLTVAFYDINGLHLINDTYGHHEGDNLLLYVSKIIEEGLTEPDLLFRLSEDEFILALYDETEDGAAKRMEKALELLEKKREQFGIYYDASFCYGVTAVYPSDKFSVNEIITRADERMYIQKRNFHIDRAGMRLRRNTERGRTAPGFDYNREFLYEALASSTYDYVFIGDMKTGVFRYPAAMERSGLINQLGRWIFSQAAAQCNKWRRYRPDFRMSINVSYHQLRKGDIVPDMLKKLEQFAMPPSSLTLELTESYFMKEEESRENLLDKLHGAGFTLAMDDFGMGYSSLLSLKNIPVDVVKIDRGFVKGITEDRFNAIFIGAITELCHND